VEVQGKVVWPDGIHMYGGGGRKEEEEGEGEGGRGERRREEREKRILTLTGLSAGGIAGIAIGGTFALFLCAVGIWVYAQYVQTKWGM
jgi:hypothetical protein